MENGFSINKTYGTSCNCVRRNKGGTELPDGVVYSHLKNINQVWLKLGYMLLSSVENGPREVASST